MPRARRRLVYFINVYMIPKTTLASEPLLLLHNAPRDISNSVGDGVPILCGKLREVELVGMPTQEGCPHGFFPRRRRPRAAHGAGRRERHVREAERALLRRGEPALEKLEGSLVRRRALRALR